MDKMNILAPEPSNLRDDNLIHSDRELVTVKTLAAMMDTQESTIRDWVLDGRIPYVKMPTGALRFHLATIRRWYESGMVIPQRM